MLHKQLCLLFILNIMLIIGLSTARGGRGRAGSYTGIFSNWRKHKKASSRLAETSRKIISSSPMQTALTKSLAESRKNILMRKAKSVEQKQKRRNSLPDGAQYYADAAIMPANSIYVPAVPPIGVDIKEYFAAYLGFKMAWLHNYDYPRHPHSKGDANSPVDKPQQSSNFNDTNLNQTLHSLQNTAHPSAVATAKTEIQAPWGVICIPVVFSKASNNTTELLHNTKTICYRAGPSSSYWKFKNIKSTTPVQIIGDILEN